MKYFKILLILFTLTLFSCQGQENKKIILLDAKTFSEKIDKKSEIQLIDVRTPEEFNEQHISGAKNINWKATDFEEKASKLDKSQPVYVYCKSGGRSAQATAKLSEMGFTEIYELDGGIGSWNKANLPK
ncbi:rhodanese-like domain-containing protein [Flavobacterium sp. SM2513]|uniref:rhodanese-like domain-containing protein n=1 Tax=Flavobacterium sp. SM2513 TaxID=3424766 RepID=UPI003D7FF4D7